MVFFDGAWALPGLRRSLVFARGECQQGADISSPPQSELGLRAWQVFGGSWMRFLLLRDAQKRRRAGQRKTKISTVMAVSEQPEAPRLQFSSWCSHNILKFPALNDTMEGAHRALSAKNWRVRMGVGLL